MARLPVPNPIVNNVFVSYQYQISPTAPLTTGENTSEDVTININTADLLAIESVDPPYAKVGSMLTYTVTLANAGNVSGENIILIDTIPAGTTFIPNSLSINGLTTSANPNFPGVAIPDIAASGIATATWQVIVNTIPLAGRIANNAVVNYSYTVSPTSAPLTRIINSNVVLTTINQAYIDNATGGMSKSANVRYATLNDTITYTIVLKNTGNQTATSVVLTDTIADGTSFISNSVTLNGATQPDVYPYPHLGVPIGSIGPNGVAIVTFKVTVNSIPTTNYVLNNSSVTYKYSVNPGADPVVGGGNSNIVLTTIAQACINNNDGGFVKSVTPMSAKIGDTLAYYIVLKNTGNQTATNIILKDTIPSGTTFVANSFSINGAAQIGANPQTGVSIGNLLPNAVMTTSFNVTVTSIPSQNQTNNIANLEYKFIVDPSLPQRISTGSSNNAPVSIKSAIVGFSKSVNPQFTIPGDTLTYTVLITNTGNVTANNVILYDTIPTGATFIPNSVKINTTPRLGENPQLGVNIPNVGPRNTMAVTFEVKVN